MTASMWLISLLLACGLRGDVTLANHGGGTIYHAARGTDLTGPWLNRLSQTTSPYLKMHEADPVDWHPWGDEAFALAAERGVPVFLSIGYYACHWCHVMHEESFSDPAVSAFLNDNFVAIKVDREQRPDVDALYMDAVHLLNRNGGWPASIWMTPDREPFFAGTYFPPASRHGRMGFRDVLERIVSDWKDRPTEIHELAGRVRAELAKRATPSTQGPVPAGIGRAAAHDLVSSWDPQNKGWGRQRQFPMTANLQFLLDHARQEGNADALGVVTGQLDAMDKGGIHDHLGGGFHRYTVDQHWRVPHFEKMLYDNGQLLRVYAEAAHATGDARFAVVAKGIADFLLLEMQSEGGAFYSSQSADSEGEEGTFYVWTPSQIRSALSDPEPFLAAYGVTERGNFEGRRTVLIRRDGDPESESLLSARRTLYEARAQREHPPTDNKLVVAWNGLTISGLARTGRLLGEPRYIEAAQRAAHHVLQHLSTTGELPRILAPGSPIGVLEDYAFFGEALLDLYEADGDSAWLLAADRTAGALVARFHDPDTGALYQSEASEGLLVRRTDQTDGAEPSGPGRALSLLRRLYALGAPNAAETVIQAGLENARWVLQRAPGNAPSIASVAAAMSQKSTEVVLASDPAHSKVQAFRNAYNDHARPSTVLSMTDGTTEPLHAFLGLRGKTPGASGFRAFVCHDRICHQPTEDLQEFIRQLKANPSG